MTANSILVVEDEELLRLTICRKLKNKGYLIAEAGGVKDALTELRQSNFDLVLTDLVMDDGNGITILKESKNINPNMPVILMTEHGSTETVIEALRLGASDYILKPCQLEEMVFRTEKVLSKRALEKNLRKKTSELSSVIDHLDLVLNQIKECILLVTEKGIISQFNHEAEATFGYSPEEIVGRSLEVLIPEELRISHRNGLMKYLETGESKIFGVTLEVQGLKKDGSQFPIELLINQLDLEGQRHFLGIIRDISQRKKSEEALEASNKMINAIRNVQSQYILKKEPRVIFDQLMQDTLDLTGSKFSFLGEVVKDSEGKKRLKVLTLTNISWDENTRNLYEKAEALGLEFENLETLFGAVIVTGKPVISNDPANDPRSGGLPPGHPILESFMGLPFFQGEELTGMVGMANRPGGYDQEVVHYLEPFVSSCSNLVQAYRKDRESARMEAALRESGENLALAQEISRLGNWSLEILTKGMAWSEEVFRIFGFGPNQFEPTYEALLETIHRDDRDDFHQANMKAINEKGSYNIDCRIVRPDGETRFVNQQSRVICEWGGKAVKLLTTIQDITERKQAEDKMRFYANELKRSNQDLEEFAYIASHDMQEPLRKIIAFGDRLQNRMPDMDGQSADYLDRMRNGAQRMQGFINDLLEYSRVITKTKPFKKSGFDKIVQLVLEDLDLKIRQTHATVHVASLPVLKVDDNQMYKVFFNLISNALKYSREGVPPQVRLEAAFDEIKQTWTILVEDNGIGFEEKYAQRIFKPFERLYGRSAFEGTGIGLAICEKIIHRHGGTISAKSVPGKGSMFFISLPAKPSF